MKNFAAILRIQGGLALCLLLAPAFVFAAPPKATSGAPVDFDRDVRPILAEKCFACHGFDAGKRQANLRLDTPEGAFQKRASGSAVLIPGSPNASLLYLRVSSRTMPPASSGKKLADAQIATLKRWIAQGAKYAPHWSFVPPKRPPLPAVRNAAWPRNPIDRFLLARLEQEGLQPSPEADKRTLIRRVTLDLTGVPPTAEEVNLFLADHSPAAYEKVVDRLLANPHYGERMTLAWLDLARYADTHGYHIDSQRDMWRWREWVIAAYNRNLPYDQFVIQQLAGDMLPNATFDQKIASGFNRNHPIDFEGGAIPEEYAAAYIFDRIDTTATTFMGLTMRCAQCHDHKYDPITQKDFYRFYAFFNNVPEQGLDGQKGNAVPYLKSPYPEQQAQMDEYNKQIGDLQGTMKARAAERTPAVAAWAQTALAEMERSSASAVGLVARYRLDEKDGARIHDALGRQPVGAIQGKPAWAEGKVGGALSFDGSSYVELGTGIGFDRNDKASYGAWIYPTAREAMTVLSRMDDGADFRGWDIFLIEGKVYAHLIHTWESNAIRVNTKDEIPLNQWTHVFVTYDGSSKAKGVHIYINGKPAELDITHDSLTDTIKTEKPAFLGRRNPAAPFKGRIDEARFYSRELSAAEVAQLVTTDSIRPILITAAERRTPEQRDALSQYYLENNDAPYRKLNTELAAWTKKRDDLDSAIPTTMVMQEMDKPRDTYILLRGQYDKPGEKVTAAIPAVFGTLPGDAPPNRLSLAKWLTDPAHPLTARVAVNRYWQIYFGYGLVRTPENFGTQGERPTHPELLDWLATEFIRTGWDVKAMQRLLVTSATYRQSSRVTPELLERDPENRLLARGPRFRLPAETIRDQALAISGLLVNRIGGPSVKPYHPAGLWEEMAFGGGFSAQSYVQDHGESLYRRSMYTFWKRTVPPPSLQTFDAPEREFCMVRRSVTNTPLQALVLMNDPTYVEASRRFAERILTECGAVSPQARLNFAYQLALSRYPKEAEVQTLTGILGQQLARFRADKAAAQKLLSVGESKRDEKLDVPELAAWTAVASILLNLDETITKG
jgi:hypothetical protein